MPYKTVQMRFVLVELFVDVSAREYKVQTIDETL
jgi:hypothetical protein